MEKEKLRLGISPLVDFAFKLMLASVGHERVTVHLLNSILGAMMRITNVVIKNPMIGPNFKDDKWIVLDILAEDETGRKFNIEMQTTIPQGLRQRLAFYDARLYADQMREGHHYHKLRPAIVICVLEKPLLSHTRQLHTEFRLRDESGHALTDDMQVHLLELTKLTFTRENLNTATPVERWAFFLLNAENMTMEEVRELFPEPEFAEAAGVLEMIRDTPEQMDDYISRMKFLKDETWRIEVTREEALREGRIQGHNEGRNEGRIEGRIEGLKEGLIGQIMLLQELLGVTDAPLEKLSTYDTTQLTNLCEQLRLRLRSRQTV